MSSTDPDLEDRPGELTVAQWRDLTAKATRRAAVYALLAAGAFLAYRAGHVSGCFGLGVGSALAVLALFHLAGALLGRHSAQKAEIERETLDRDEVSSLADEMPVDEPSEAPPSDQVV